MTTNTEKLAARRAVKNAVKKGSLIPQPCEVCGEPAEAHHEDYKKRLEVRWLCKIHHLDALKIRELAFSGIPQKEIAASYGLSKGHVSMIVNGRTWNTRPYARKQRTPTLRQIRAVGHRQGT